jgi:hypothetical protein
MESAKYRVLLKGSSRYLALSSCTALAEDDARLCYNFL